jgi:hypothetical protein
MKRKPIARAKDYSGTIKEILGEPNTCSSCQYATVKGGKDWYCERHQGPTSLDYSCADYQEYAGNRRK